MELTFRYRPILWLAIPLFVACGGHMEQNSLTVDISGGGGRTLYLESFSGRNPIRLDSVKLAANGSGSLGLYSLPMDYYRITFGDGAELVLALDSTTSARVSAPADALFAATSVKGSPHTEAFFQFQQEAGGFDARREQIREGLLERPGDAGLLAELNTLNNQYHELCKRTATTDPSAPVALSAVSRLDIDNELATFKLVRDALHPVMGRSGFYTKFKNQVDRIEQQEITKRLQQEEVSRLGSVAPVGGPAPAIKQATPQGKELALSDLRGKVVLIDFWASWCRPCRVENPRLKEVYAKYKDKGFEILGVSLDRDKDAWTKAIKDDGLPWKHVSDLKYWQNAAALEYAVSSIPHGVLVDREGNIIAKGVRAGQLDQRLAQVFAQ